MKLCTMRFVLARHDGTDDFGSIVMHQNTRFWVRADCIGAKLIATEHGQSERTIQTLEDMLRACVMDFGAVGVRTHLPLIELFPLSLTQVTTQAFLCAPSRSYGGNVDPPVIWTEVRSSTLMDQKIMQSCETTRLFKLRKD
ncbi:hypothetical protein Tco_1474990 [Tanacetum coccineum]